jgi:hypothetical protein
MGNGGLEHIFCPSCDRAGNPSRMVKMQGGHRTEGMAVKCANGLHTFTYSKLMSLHPRMDKPDFVEKQPPNTITMTVWVYPEVLESLRQKFEHNLNTTMCSAITALADPDTVLIEGEHAREIASLGIKRGREVLGLAREVKELRTKLERAELQMQVLEPILRALGGGLPGAVAPMESPMGQKQPPRAQFENLVESDNGLLMPSSGRESSGDFTFAGPKPAASSTPGFVTRLQH